MQNRFDLLDTDVMSLFMIIALDIFIIMRSSINCSVVICAPTVLFSILRETTSETYGPRVYSHHINLHHFIIALLFTLPFTFYFASIYQKYQKYYLSSLSDLTLVSDREGIDNP